MYTGSERIIPFGKFRRGSWPILNLNFLENSQYVSPVIGSSKNLNVRDDSKFEIIRGFYLNVTSMKFID